MTNTPPMDSRDASGRAVRVELDETNLRDVFQHVVELAGLSIPEVTDASVTVVQGEAAHTPAFTGGLALTLDESQYELGHGPCMQAASATTIELIGDMAAESRWPDWTERALQAGVHSSLSIGLPIHDTVSGALNLYATRPHVFDDDAVAVAQTLAGYATLAMANAYLESARTALARHVDAAMESEAVIEQAKGVTMGARHCTAEEAFAILTAMAHDTGRTVREVAQAVVDRTGEAPGQ